MTRGERTGLYKNIPSRCNLIRTVGILVWAVLICLYAFTQLKYILLITSAMGSLIIGCAAWALGPFLNDAATSSQEWVSKKKCLEKWKIGQPYLKKYSEYGGANVYQVWLEYNKHRVKLIDFIYTASALFAALAVYTEFLMPASADQGVAIFGRSLGSEHIGAFVSGVSVITTISFRLTKAIYELWFQPALEAEAQKKHPPLVCDQDA